MDKTYRSMTELLEADAVYQELEKQRLEYLAAFQKVMETLAEEQQDAIIAYIGVAEEQHWRAVEILTEDA